MKDRDSRSWIVGEGIPARDHTSQGEERVEATTSGFQLIEARGKGSVVRRFPYVYVGASGDRRIYANEQKERCVFLKKHVVSGLYSRSNFARFVCSCIIVSGPLSLLREP
jgi:hypothetical protein